MLNLFIAFILGSLSGACVGAFVMLVAVAIGQSNKEKSNERETIS